ncbi:glycosyltransferase family 2 protein [Alkalibacterium olivapovliticus]|uniref:Glycosyltransferase involved in cell wall biosynthesis n=1 Tax=Alkalibacterium olivapovliticus TaxID=99907 RepID=A0A2T0W844_9LACT|nr:glycosyltransferase family 2 protein [Alkalibacterium olivapovliticus]PRY82704.1 glycosyltransferase involved in cell wall biosynthesis [Alkalibacterium olivapovliticus]
MIRPFFSIVMPAYNCENTVRKTITSLKKQEWTDFECIIVNDGSTDNSQTVIDSAIAHDSRFTQLTKKNEGPGSARNMGIDSAKGHYLYLMDSDDALPEMTLKKYAMTLEKQDPDLIVSSYRLDVMDGADFVDERIVKVKDEWLGTHELFLAKLHELMEKQLMYVIWNKVYKLDIVKANNIRFPHYSSCEDRLFNLQYYSHVNTCQISSDVLYNYTFDGRNSLTNKFLPNKFETFEEFYRELVKLTDKNLPVSSALFLKGTMSCIIPFHSKDCPYSFKEKRRKIKEILNHPSVKKASKYSATNSPMRKIMAGLFRSKSVSLNGAASYVMFYVSHLSPKLIEKLKGNF